MKKMMMVLMMVFTVVAGLFAYEPKKECFKVYKLINSVSYSETVKVEDDVLYNSILLDDNRCFRRYLSVDLRYLKYETEKNYLELLESRTRVEHYKKQMKLYKRYKKDSLVKFTEEYIEKEINKAVYEIPFVTRENFYKISKRKYEKTFIKYMKAVLNK